MRRGQSALNGRTLVSIAGLLALIVASLAYLNSLGLSVTNNVNVRHATMMVQHTNGLVVGSKVLLRGVPIGRVTSVKPSVEGVRIEWNYKDKYSIPVNSAYRVDNLSALGETYLGITPKTESGPVLSNDVVLTASTITVPTTVDELSARVTRFLEQVDSRQVRSIVDEINEGLPADQEVLTNIQHASALLEATILATRGSLTTLLTDFQPLLTKGAGISDSLAASGDPVERFAVGLAKFLSEGGKKASTSADGKDGFIVTTNSPTSLNREAKPLLEHVQKFLDEAAPDLRVLSDAALPSVASGARSLRSVDLGALMRTALATAGDGYGLVVKVGGR
ncbi:MlaD family protein [Gordonia rubripertincta]|uniref:MlaD family protein n=1 Tax=Gordonia rubripertincta TaxID=36822 RepID=UPI000B8D4D18|nr:MlaD family protein [Gordonia rubripertincta]ASR01252.1 mce related protein [Gordonia rubripertincta]